MGAVPTFIGSYRNTGINFNLDYGVRPKILWTPGSNGSRIHVISVSSGDAGINTGILYIGNTLTLQPNMSVGTLVDGGGGNDTLTRTVGSFITDGWKVGDRFILSGCTTLANDFSVILTAVAALTLTFATDTIDTGEVLPSGAKLIRGSVLTTQTIAIGAGRDPAVVALSMLNATLLPCLDDSPFRYLTLGPNDLLLASLGTVLTGSEDIGFITMGGDY